MTTSSPTLTCVVASRRQQRGLTQAALATRVGISRQALSSIEGERSAPSTPVAMRIARELGCRVDDIFALPELKEAPIAHIAGEPGASARAVAARISDRWVAHPLQGFGHHTADVAVESGRLRFLRPADRVAQNILFAGCAPILGLLTERATDALFGDTMRWIPATSGASIDLLERRLVHVAGLHLYDEAADEFNTPHVRRAMPHRKLRMITLAKWEQGLAIRAGNPCGIRGISDLSRPELRIVSRARGSGARQLLERQLAARGLDPSLLEHLPESPGHDDVAWRVAHGVADVGPTIRAAAVAAGADFLPLSQERFDLVLDQDLLGPMADDISELLQAATLHTELSHLPGYDVTETGKLVLEIT